MEDLIQKSKLIVGATGLELIRSKYVELDWDSRLVGVLGARGTGKSTLVLQYLKKTYGLSDHAAYWSLDDIYFSNYSLIETIENFYHFGGRFLVLDEVHKYPTWARELKNAFDFFKELKTDFQIKGEPNSFLAIADLPIGSFNRIPLWLFGFVR